MKCISLIGGLFVLSCLSSLYAQVGINTTDPQATLDIRSSDLITPTNTDGLLIPKIDEFPLTNPTATQDGMMVFVTGDGTPAKGFYYWENTSLSWMPLSTSASPSVGSWLETGNTGTNPTTNFIGTTDGQDLSFRTNNQEKMRLTQQGQLEFLNTGSSVFIGEGVGGYDDLTDNRNTFIGAFSGFSNTNGDNNSFFGFNSGGSNTTGNFNSFFGNNSGEYNISGAGNSFFGNFSGQNNNIGNSNSFFGTSSGRLNNFGSSNNFFGANSGRNNTNGNLNSFYGSDSGIGNVLGSSNTALGVAALQLNVNGSNNVAIGVEAGRGSGGNSKSNGVFIGFQAGMFEDNNNRLYIESSSSANPLIYGEFDNDILRINGTFEVNNPAVTGYAFPNTDGTVNQVLQTDGNGAVSFVETTSLDTNDWKKSGNAETDASVDFIGTTDAQDLSFRTNNQEKMRLTQDGRIQLTNLEHSVYIGEDAGANENLIFGNNSYVGYMAGYLSNNQENNSFFGAEAGALNSASQSTYIGALSGYNSGGHDNTYLGFRAGHTTSFGEYNIYIGSRSGENVSGDNNYNIFVGAYSAQNFTGGQRNIALGFETMVNADGENNIAIGDRSGNTLDGDNNSFVGSLAGYLVGGDNNTFMGHRAGFDAPGSLNTFIGSQAGESIDGDSNSNVFIGSNVADQFNQGDFNVAMGANAMRFGEGDENVVIGSGALAFANQNFNTVIVGSRASENSNGAANSVIIGELAAGNADFTSDSVIIGHQAGLSLTDISQKLIIDNEDSSFPLIYGEFDTPLLGFYGDVAINHQDPQASLHVQSFENPNIQSAVAILESDNSNRPVLLFAKAPPTSTNDFSAGMSLEYDGRGADTSNKMVVNGIGGNSLFEFQNGGNLKVLDGDIVIEGTAGDRHLRMDDAAGNNDRVLLRQAGTNHIFAGDIDNNNGNFTIRTGGANAVTVLSGSRNVGIGLTNPAFRLQLSTNSAAKPTSQLWTVVSDSRLKKNVRSFTDGLETLKQIDPVWFTYNGQAEMPNDTGVGTIAQELEQVAPYLVKDWQYTSEDGRSETYKAVDYGPLTFIMVNAIKEQEEKIVLLEEKLHEQEISFEAIIKSLEERLERLEN